jgi:hypothetical protein
MDAVIYLTRDGFDAGAVDVAGRPLVQRQVQWLRAVGCDRIAVEVGPDDASSGAAAALAEDPNSTCVRFVLSRSPLGPRELAARAGLSTDAILAVPSDVLGDADLAPLFSTRGGATVVARMRPPDGLSLDGASVTLVRGGASIELALDEGAGVLVRSARDGLSVGAWVIRQQIRSESASGDRPSGVVSVGNPVERAPLSVLLHGAADPRGCVLARGSVIEPGATIHGPVVLGANARICAGASVGPDVVLGAGVVVEPGAALERCVVLAEVIVGPCEHRDRVLGADGACSIDDAPSAPRAKVLSAFDLASRGPEATSLLARALAFVIAVALAPVGVASAPVAALLARVRNVAAGRARWWAVDEPSGDRAPVDSLEPALVRDGASARER